MPDDLVILDIPIGLLDRSRACDKAARKLLGQSRGTSVFAFAAPCWALNKRRPMKHNKKTKEGAAERVVLLRRVFPQIETHLANRPARVGADDLLDGGGSRLDSGEMASQ